MKTGPESEIGRELKVSELKPHTVVVVKAPGHNAYLTLWVRSIGSKLVEFYAGEMLWHVINFIQPDGSIHDDQGRAVHVFEYLGEV